MWEGCDNGEIFFSEQLSITWIDLDGVIFGIIELPAPIRWEEVEFTYTLKNRIKELGVRRPLKGDAFYREWMRLSDSCKRIFRPGKERTALSLDEAAMSLGKSVDEILEAIG